MPRRVSDLSSSTDAYLVVGDVTGPSYALLVQDVWFDEMDDAEAFVAALDEAGYASSVRREMFAGEEDDEDLASVVAVEPWDAVAADLADEAGGWVPPEPDGPPAPVVPLELPTQPKRLKRPRA